MRMRLVGWNVQPVVMADDGETLVALNVGAQLVPAGEAWETFKNGGDVVAMELVRAQVEGEPPAPPVHNGRVTAKKAKT